VNGTSRNHLAAVNPVTGALEAWNPDASDTVYTMAATGTLVYVGGAFTNVGLNVRPKLAAIDDTTGVATAWNPSPNDIVETLLISQDGNTVYIGGAFTLIGPDTRNHLGAVDIATASATVWDPNADSNIKTMAQDGNTLYVGGNFTSIGGDSRSYIAAVDLTSASATAWNPSADSNVASLVLNGSVVYAGGDFTSIGGTTRYYVAALDKTTGNVTADWSKKLENSVATLALSDDASKMYVGGFFMSYGGEDRNNLAEIDLTTGQVTSWNPNPDGAVYALAFSPDSSILYAGGDFTHVGVTARRNIASFTRGTGALTAWDPSANGSVYALTVGTSGTVYAGGAFTNIGGAARQYLGSIDPTTGAATAWDASPAPGLEVRTLAVNRAESEVYVGTGKTTCVPGFPPRCRHNGAVDAYKTSDGSQDYEKVMGHHVYSIALSPDEQRLYVGGAFTGVDSLSHNYIEAIVPSDGSEVTVFNPVPDSYVYAILPDPTGAYIYIAGSFTAIGSTARNYLAALDAADGSVAGWNPNADSTDRALAANPDFTRLLVGGDHMMVGSSITPFFASFEAPTVQFTQSAAHDNETAGSVNVGLTLSQVSPVDVRVDFVLSGTATNGADYTIPASAVIPAGSLTANVAMNIIDDSITEPDETAVVTIVRAYHASIGSTNPYTLTIWANDSGGGGGGGGGSGGGGLPVNPAATLKPVGPFGISINQDAVKTLSRVVFLKLAAGANVTKMSISNSPDFHNSSIEPFAKDKIWDLCNNDGWLACLTANA